MIRPAKFQDIPRLVGLARELHQKSKYSAYKEDVKAFKQACMGSISSGNHCLFVAEIDGEVEGFLIGITAPLYVFTKAKYATDIGFYVTDKGRGEALAMASEFDKWALEEQGVEEAWLAVTDAVNDNWERLGKAYTRMGYQLRGGIYMKKRIEQ